MNKQFFFHLLRKTLLSRGFDLQGYNRALDVYAELYKKYHDYTMIHQDLFTANLDLCRYHKDIAGDFVECGVWRGGMSAAIAEILGKEKKMHLFDSFEGLPPARDIDGLEALQWQQATASPCYHDNCNADESFAKDAMAMAGHKNYQLYKGWFDKTLPSFEGSPIAILRLDGDWYDSILVCLEQLFPHVVGGGLVILDDYYAWDGCARAVHDYLSKSQIPSRIYQWNNHIAYIVKKDALTPEKAS